MHTDRAKNAADGWINGSLCETPELLLASKQPYVVKCPPKFNFLLLFDHRDENDG